MEVEFKLVSPGLVGVATALEGKYGYDVIYAISDYADYIPGMAFAYSAMLVRTCGNVMFTVGVALYETFILVYVLGQLCVYSHGLSKAAREQELELQPGPAEELQAETPEQFELETSPHASPHRTMLS
ncbi:hypothetical protein HPB47_012389 [Ixodes persulcatus]|uniref:Uncharacterized protein n=1 Tax=Ixodes persulcatus TaxID=34615 RepID=A0AC60NTJ3_IXOPE|nr:hypothetical protein HPB47_012389 [Ixodes persulcatus]